MVKRADSEFSGRRALRMVVRFGVVGVKAGPWLLDSGTLTWYSFIIWSAILRRSEDRRGARFLIWVEVSIVVPT